MRVPIKLKGIRLKRNLTRKEKHQLILLFNSWTVYYLMETIYNEFKLKSLGMVDSLGVKWKPLSESRRIYKPLQRGEKTKFGIGRLRRNKKELLITRNPPINIDTGRLLASLAPGVVIGTMYYSRNEDQKVVVTSKSISVKIKVPYADQVQEERPFVPLNINPWLKLALDKAMPHLREGLHSVS